MIESRMRVIAFAMVVTCVFVRCLFPAVGSLGGGVDASQGDVVVKTEAGQIAYVQQSTTTPFPPAMVALPGAIAAGDTLVVCSAFPLDFGSLQVSDSLGRTYALVASQDGIGGGRNICFASIGGPGGSDTISFVTTNTTLVDGAAHNMEAYVFEYQNITALDDELAVAGTLKSGVDASWDAGSVTASSANELIFAWVEGDFAARLDPSFTSRSTLDDNNVGDKIVPAPGNYAVTGGANASWVVVAATFK